MQDQNSQNEENKNDDMCEIYHPHEDSCVKYITHMKIQ